MIDIFFNEPMNPRAAVAASNYILVTPIQGNTKKGHKPKFRPVRFSARYLAVHNSVALNLRRPTKKHLVLTVRKSVDLLISSEIEMNLWSRIQRIRTNGQRRPGARRRRFVWMEWRGDLHGALETRQLLSHFSHLGPAAQVWIAARSGLGAARTLNLPDALVYVPPGLQPGHTYPMVAAFTPDGKLKRTLGDWTAAANRFHWIVYASKQFSDKAENAAPDFDAFVGTIQSSVENAMARFPVDATRVVLAGFSGGGFMAEYLNARNPGLAAAVVIDANGLYAYGDDPEVPSKSNPEVPFPAGEFSASRRLAAFLYSPSDREFGSAARTDRAFYQQNGWSTLLLSYPGGHVDAPATRYLRAATWIATQPAWLSDSPRG